MDGKAIALTVLVSAVTAAVVVFAMASLNVGIPAPTPTAGRTN